MNRIWLAVAVATWWCVSAGGASAAWIRTFEFRGEITYAYNNLHPPTAGIQVGDAFSGTLTVQADLPPGYISDNGSYAAYPEALVDLSFSINGLTFSTTQILAGANDFKGAQVGLFNDWDTGTTRFDELIVGATGQSVRPIPNGTLRTSESMNIDLLAFGGQTDLLSSTLLADAVPDLSRANTAKSITYNYTSYNFSGDEISDARQGLFQGTLTSLKLRDDTTPVATPEPASVLSLGIGVASLLGYRGLRRRKELATV